MVKGRAPSRPPSFASPSAAQRLVFSRMAETAELPETWPFTTACRATTRIGAVKIWLDSLKKLIVNGVPCVAVL